jgi:YHS domain-containing protein
MKATRMLTTTLLLAAFLAAPLAGFAAEGGNAKKKEKAKPYPLKTCLVSDEEINDKGEMKPFTFVHEGQEIKLCCKSCKKDFDKDPKKYLAKLEEAVKKGENKGQHKGEEKGQKKGQDKHAS